MDLEKKNQRLREKIKEQQKKNAREEERLNSLQEDLRKCHEEIPKAENDVKTCAEQNNDMEYALKEGQRVYEEFINGYGECKDVEKRQKRELFRIKDEVKEYKEEWGQWMEGFMEECQKNQLLEKDCAITVKDANMHLQLPVYTEIKGAANTMLEMVKAKILKIPEDVREKAEMQDFINQIAQQSKDLMVSLNKNDPDILIKIVEYYLTMFSKKDGLVIGL
jgi:chromosome segregation ATPase